MDIVDICHQSLNSIIADFLICKDCGIVDADDERTIKGYKCPHCGKPSKRGRLYFGNNVRSMIDLMQEFYHGISPQEYRAADFEARKELINSDTKEKNHRLAVIIFFCSLGEILLGHFLKKLMLKMELPEQIQERLLSDNLFVKQRTDKLFPSLTGIKWNKAIEKLSEEKYSDYRETVKFYLEVSEKRNKFLHEGNKWAVSWDTPEQCIRCIQPLISLFVALHNEYIVSKLK